MFRLLRKIKGSQAGAESERERESDDRETSTGTASVQSGTVTATDARGAEADADPDERAVPLDQVFGILSNHRRRHVLRVVSETEQLELGDLAEQLAAREHDKPRANLTSQERKRCYVALYQVHLPKLADVEAINYDESRGLIEPGPTLHSFTYYLPDDPESASTETQDRGWTAYIRRILK